MTRVVLNVISLAIYAGVIIGVDLALRSAGMDHFLAWVLGIVAGSLVMMFLRESGLYSRSWQS
jgi:hypothetical protein